MPIKIIEAGIVVRSYFGKAKPELETKDGQLWLEVDASSAVICAIAFLPMRRS
jgi:hypothetical protein